MVELPGLLERSTLGDVLGALHRDRVSGALRLDEIGAGSGHRHVIHWRDGLIHHVETSRAVPLARWASDDPRRVSAGRWTYGDATKRLRLQRLEALFALTQARISFRVMGHHPARVAEPLAPEEFLHGRRRQRDAEREVEPTPRSEPLPREEDPRERALRTLGLSGTPRPDAVRAAFRQMALRWHPDRYPDVGDQTRAALCRRFAQISTAYDQLRTG
jgi:DnaJ-domain-containing protein 1